VDDVERAIVARVSRQAAEWFPAVPRHPTVHLRTLGTSRRSRVHAVSLGDPAGPPLLVAKVRRAHSAVACAGDGRPRRPSLVPDAPDEGELTEREYAGLRLLHETFAEGDPRFGAVRPLSHLREHHTILMEFVQGTRVRELLVRSSRLHPTRRGRGPSPEDVLPVVGSWLRKFHDSTPTTSYPARQATADDVVVHFAAQEEFLGRHLGRRFGALAGAGSELAAELLPPGALSHVVGHGDFAPRNVLLDADGRIVIVDPLVRWAVPAHEDLCRFLVGMQLLGWQLLTRGAALSPATLERWEDLVISGYYGDGEPSGSLRCFQLLILLDKWSALVQPAGTGPLRTAGRLIQQRTATGYVRAQAERLVRQARTAGRSP
jgi:hypothetical protein